MNIPVQNKAGNFFNQLSHYQLLKEYSAPCTVSYSTAINRFKTTWFLPGDSKWTSSAWEATYSSDTFMLHKSPLQQQNLVLLSAFGGFLLATHEFWWQSCLLDTSQHPVSTKRTHWALWSNMCHSYTDVQHLCIWPAFWRYPAQTSGCGEIYRGLLQSFQVTDMIALWNGWLTFSPITSDTTQSCSLYIVTKYPINYYTFMRSVLEPRSNPVPEVQRMVASEKSMRN